MSRRPARVTQADVARAIRAAQQCGAGEVRVLPDGTIAILPQAGTRVDNQQSAIEDGEEVVL
jgi:hypothetical protein